MAMDKVGMPPQGGNICGTCGAGFAQRSHLNRHFERKHTDQTTPQAVAKRQKVREIDRKDKRERRVDNPILREKHRLESQVGRLVKKVGHTNEAPAPLPVVDGAAATVVDTAPVTASVAIAANPSARVAIESELLTTANVKSFFTPKYEAPRSKEERAANPRPSEVWGV